MDSWWAGEPAIRYTRWMPHIPTPPQHAFLYLDDLEVLFGGAAGGGKSDTLLMAAAQYVDVPGYAALLLRRTYADLSLPGAIMARSKEWWLNTDAKWNEIEKTWTFPSGATITFGYLQTANDVYRYQGAEFQFIGIDELTQIAEAEYKYLLSRLRRPTAGLLSEVPLRMRGATNPGGRSHKQVKRRFIDRTPDPEDPEDTQTKCDARIFIPSKLDDNPHVDREAYKEALAGLDPLTRKQLLDGDWSVREPGAWVYDADQIATAKDLGRHYDHLRAERQIHPVGGEVEIWADFGVHTHILLGWPLEGGGWYVAKEVAYEGHDMTKAIGPTAAAIQALGYPVRRFNFDGSMPQLAKIFRDRLMADAGLSFKYLAIPFNKYKKPGVQHINWLLANTDEDRYPQVAISPTGCPVLLEQMERLFYDDPETDRIHKEEDHGPDALIAGMAPDASKRTTRIKEMIGA